MPARSPHRNYWISLRTGDEVSTTNGEDWITGVVQQREEYFLLLRALGTWKDLQHKPTVPKGHIAEANWTAAILDNGVYKRCVCEYVCVQIHNAS